MESSEIDAIYSAVMKGGVGKPTLILVYIDEIGCITLTEHTIYINGLEATQWQLDSLKTRLGS